MTKTLWKYGQWSLLAVFLYFIVRRGWSLWNESEASLDGISWGVVATGIPIVLASWLTCVWVWRRLIIAHGEQPPWIPTCCAHYCGQIGKYVPGKGMVLLIRGGMLKPYGVPLAVGIATATYETLLTMGAGLLLTLCLAPLVLPGLAVHGLADDSLLRAIIDRLGTRPFALSATILVLTFASLPLISWLMNRIASKMVKLPHVDQMQPMISEVAQTSDRELDAAVEEIRGERVRSRDLAAGIIVSAVGWMVQSLSLGVVLYAIGVTSFAWTDWLTWSLAYSLATVIGFLAIFAPGGIGVREAVLVEVLRLDPDVNNQQALTAALLLRILMFAADILSGLVCYYLARWYKKRDPS